MFKVLLTVGLYLKNCFIFLLNKTLQIAGFYYFIDAYIFTLNVSRLTKKRKISKQ